MSLDVQFSVKVHQDKTHLHVNGNEIFLGSMDELLEKISDAAASDTPQLVVTPNVDQIIRLRDSRTLRSAYENACLLPLDGAPLVLLARMLGIKNPHRNTGADILPALTEYWAGSGRRIAIVGGRSDIARKAVTNLRRRFPGALVQAIDFPFLKTLDDAESLPVIQALNDLRPDAVFLCLGSPKQEAWYMTWSDKIPPAVYIGAGAAVDFAAEAQSRAPKIVQHAGLEWGWRLLQEPTRLAKRYLWDSRHFFVIVGRSLWRKS